MNDINGLGLIDVPKSCDMLAARLREQILSGVYSAGQQLPAERELMEQTGISRNAVREALRILETEGLITTRLGRYGGSFVCQPSDEMFSRYLKIFAKSHSIPLRSLVEARQALEPQVALLAALNRTDEDLAALDAGLQELEQATDTASFIEKNMQYQLLVANASHNQLLKVFLTSLATLIQDVAGGTEEFIDDSVRREVVHLNRQVQLAIIKQDGNAAVRRMARHIKAYEERAARVGLKIK